MKKMNHSSDKQKINGGGGWQCQLLNFKKVSELKNLVKLVFKIGHGKNPKNQPHVAEKQQCVVKVPQL
jgi:hypothetical protein